MALPPELKARMKGNDMKVTMKEKGDHVVIEGKTVVPFGMFEKLLSRRKVQPLMKKWQREGIILSADLLAQIASAGEEKKEDRSKAILTAFVIGIGLGFVVTAVFLTIMNIVGIQIGTKELLAGLGVLLLLAAAVYGSLRIQTGAARNDFIEKIEKISNMFSR